MGRGASPHPHHACPRRRLPRHGPASRLRTHAGRQRGDCHRSDDAQREHRRSPASGAVPRVSEVAAAGHEMVRHYTAMGCQKPGPVPRTSSTSGQGSASDRLGGVERHRLRQQRARRAHRALRRLHRHLCRHHGPRARSSDCIPTRCRWALPSWSRSRACQAAIRRRDAFFALLGRPRRPAGRLRRSRSSTKHRRGHREDQLKATGAAAASSGRQRRCSTWSVITPRHSTRREAFGGRAAWLARARDTDRTILASGGGVSCRPPRAPTAAVSLGTPTPRGRRARATALRCWPVAMRRPVGRVLRLDGPRHAGPHRGRRHSRGPSSAGVQVVTDTCTLHHPHPRRTAGCRDDRLRQSGPGMRRATSAPTWLFAAASRNASSRPCEGVVWRDAEPMAVGRMVVRMPEPAGRMPGTKPTDGCFGG